MGLKERLILYIDYKRITVQEFEYKVGLSNGAVSKMGDNTRRSTLDKISNRFGDLSISWLITGEGDMLNTAKAVKEPPPLGLTPAEPPADQEQGEVLTTFLVPTTAQGGKLSEFSASVRPSDCERVISPIRGVDFAITVYGDSMAPTYPSGSRVFIKKINDKSFIEWGRAYVLDTCNGAVVKILTPSEKEGHVKCISVNSDPIYAPFDIPEADIIGVYKILLCMKMEQ